MGYAARANKSARKARAAGYIKPERVTVARVRRQRLAELRSHLASMVAMQVIARMRDDNARADDTALAERMALQRGGVMLTRVKDAGVHRDDCPNATGDYRPPVPCDCELMTLIRRSEPDERETVTGANALQRMEPDHSTFTEHDVSGALAGVTRHEDRPLTPQEG